MQMAFIQMRGDDDLEPITPQVLRGLHADLMTQLRCDLAGLEALVAVPGNVSAGLVILLLGHDIHMSPDSPCIIYLILSGNKKAICIIKSKSK